MKHLTFLYSNKKEYKAAQKESLKTQYRSTLIQIFTGLTNKKKIQIVLDKINKDFPNSVIIGTTTAGEISHASMHENSTVISLSLFQNTKLKTHYVKKITTKSGQEISQEICSKNTKAAIVLSEGLHGKNYEGFISGIKQKNPQVIIAGGLSGDNFALQETFILLGKKILTKGAIAVSFSAKNLFADNRYNLNWTPIGKEFTITSSQGNLVKKIDGVNAVELFERYLGSTIFNNNAAALPDIQLLFTEGSTVVSRTPMAVDGDSLVFAGPLKEGQKVKFGFSNASSVISGSNKIGKTVSKNPAEAIYIFSCIARKTLLGKVLEKEFSSFEAVAPTAGFFTYGEFYSTNANNALLNCTTTILILSENELDKSISKKTMQDSSDKALDSITFNALTHFVEQTSNELKENIKLLNQYKNVVDTSSLVSKTDKNGIITYVNDNFCKISQYSREELIGNNHNMVRDKNVSSFIFKKMWHNILRGRIWKGLLSNKAKDGTIYYIDATIMPILDEDGNVVEFIAIRQDVSKQIQSKKRVQEKEKLIKAIFDNQDNIVIYTSKEKGMQNANKKLFEYFDYENFEDFKSKHECICDLFIDEDGYVHPKKELEWLEIISQNDSVDYKVKMLTKNGTINTFNLTIKKIENEYIINLSDITNLEHALLKAHSSEQAKGMFLANMSHEIRTPLNGILGFTDILTKKNLDKDSKRYVDIIHKSGQTLLTVVNDILDFSKIESGELALYETESNLFKEMEAAVSTFASLSKNKHINYYIYIDTTIPALLKCDIQRLKQVLNNLVSNAIKFTPAHGQVNVSITLESLSQNKAKINFSVKDSGIGVAKDKISTIFQAFSQADNSISREFGGTGLGLSISSQYVKMMSSELKINSVEGEGSEFYFSIELPVINNDQSITKEFERDSINISILTDSQEISCGINKIVYTYLNSWNCNYTELNDLATLNKNTDILIVCAKLFNKTTCQNALEKFPELQLIYIEGAEENFNCTHKKFHLIEQPMTGSSLFDKLITLTNLKNKVVFESDDSKKENKLSFNGNILIAEDNETNQMLISIMLQDRGIEYTIVNNGQEAVDEALENDIYDIILMDINMPILDGMSATKILRKANYTKPIVSLSANVIESDIISFKEAGVDEALHKPIVPLELDKVLSTYLVLNTPQTDNLVEYSYDSVDVVIISKNLAIANETIVLKLLNSFISSANSILNKLETQNIDTDITHNIKGISGSFKFKSLYDMATAFEEKLEWWTKEEHRTNKKVLISHLEELIKKINILS